MALSKIVKTSSKDDSYKNQLLNFLKNKLNKNMNIYYLYLSNLDWFNYDDKLLENSIICKFETKVKKRNICKFIAKIDTICELEKVITLWNGGCDKTEYIVISNVNLDVVLCEHCESEKSISNFNFDYLISISDILIYNEESDDYNSFIVEYKNNAGNE